MACEDPEEGTLRYDPISVAARKHKCPDLDGLTIKKQARKP
jgi:hypothetical protein